MRNVTIPCLMLAAWLAGATALGHDGGSHTRGTVHEVGGGKIMLQTADGKMVTIPLMAQTHVMRGDKMIQATDIKPGELTVAPTAYPREPGAREVARPRGACRAS
jgi:hypothetical protein